MKNSIITLLALFYLSPLFAQNFQEFEKDELIKITKVATQRLAELKNFSPNEIQVKSLTMKQDLKNKNKWLIYFTWGYNRSWHSPSDATFSSDKGTFTIHQAQAKDRPSPFDFDTYFNPAKITIPQYNLRIGIQKDHAHGDWGFEVGTDHMKWVFQNDLKYDITGDFEGPIYIQDSGQTHEVDFERIKEDGNASSFKFEYSDGHNYVHLSSFYNLNIYQTPKKKFKAQLGVEGGVGAYVPKPHLHIRQESGWHEGENGRFQLAGYGFHVGTKARLTFFNKFFIESSLRAIGIKSKSQLYSPQELTIEQSLMKSRQFYTGVGIIIKNFNKK